MVGIAKYEVLDSHNLALLKMARGEARNMAFEWHSRMIFDTYTPHDFECAERMFKYWNGYYWELKLRIHYLKKGGR